MFGDEPNENTIRRQQQQIDGLRKQLAQKQKHDCDGTFVTIEFNTRKLDLCLQCATELVEVCKSLEYTVNRIDRKG